MLRSAAVLSFGGVLVLAAGAMAQPPAGPAGPSLAAPATNPAISMLMEVPGDRFENIAEGPDGTIYATATWNGNLWKQPLGGKAVILAHPAENLQGVMLIERGDLVLTAHDRKPDFSKQPFSFAGLGSKVLVLDRTGKTLKTITAPDNTFLNGLSRIRGDLFMVADTAGGGLYTVDIGSGAIKVWLSGADLAAKLGPRGAPNGLKVWNGWAYFSRGDIYKIKIGANGAPEGEPVLAGKTGGTDDFDLSKDGTIYASRGTDIVKIPPVGEATLYTKGGCRGGCTATLVSRDGKSLFSAGGSIPVRPDPVAGHVERSPL